MESQSGIATGVGGELLSDAKGVGASAVNRLHSEIDGRKGDAVAQAQAVSSAVGQAADGLGDQAPAWLKTALHQGAEQIQKIAGSIEQKNSRQIVNDINDFARASPGTFLATCAAAGFAAVRIFKAGSSENTTNRLGALSPEEPLFESPSSNPTFSSGQLSASSKGEFV